MICNHKTKLKYRGFTIVELLVVAPIVILLIGIFISAIMAMTGKVLSTRGETDLSYSVQYALSTIEQDVKTSAAYLATNNIALTSPQGLNDDTTNFTNADSAAGSTLILNTYATTSNPIGSTRNIIRLSGPNPCSSSQSNQNNKLMTNTIYFVKANSDGTYTLWRRVILPSNYSTIGCSQPWQQPSCSPVVSGSFCKSKDIRLLDGLIASGFTVEYINDSDHETVNTIASNPANSNSERQASLATTSEIRVTINATKTVSGETISQTGTIKVASPNNKVTTTIKVLIVAGGGGGASSNGGGGGAGGLIYKTMQLASGTYGVVVGDGGTGGTVGTNGANSTFNGLVAIGGGAGGAGSANGNAGGSGGGGGISVNTYLGGAGTAGQGFAGGDNTHGASTYGSGGGGGAGGVGIQATSTNSGNGGPGLSYDISGVSAYYAAGGGGGGKEDNIYGTGGSGIGGNGGITYSTAAGAGAANTGSGGGGAANGQSVGGAGGSGVVIISYPTGSMSATGGTITTSGGNTIHTFTSSGDFIVAQ